MPGSEDQPSLSLTQKKFLVPEFGERGVGAECACFRVPYP